MPKIGTHEGIIKDMEKRTEIVRLTLTVEEKQRLQAAADEAGMPLAVYVRFVALAAAKAAK